MSDLVGQPVDRTDGRAKTTGGARYSAEFQISHLAYGVTVQSNVAAGIIRSIDTSQAQAAPGVLGVMTYQNAPRLNKPKEGAGEEFKLGEKGLLPLQEPTIYYDGQHVALVVAETFEQAEYAASQIAVECEEKPALISLEQAEGNLYLPKESMKRPLQVTRGDASQAYASAAVQSSQTYSTPVYHHNPMEPHATIAVWDAAKLTLYDSTQSVLGNRDAVAGLLGISPTDIRLISLFVGGGFGCKGFTWPHTVMAAMAARQFKRPVKIVLDRPQMFTCNGHRARTVQKIALGAQSDGKLVSIDHEVVTTTSFVDEFVETAALPTQHLYACPNLRIAHKLARINRGTPTPMRAPGEAPGTFAFECAMDELAYKVGVDPVELRLTNYAEADPENGKSWSAKNLKECYQRGAEAIEWSKRSPKPRSMPEGKLLIGYGMATAIYPANRVPASASVRIMSDGRAVGSSCTQDIGTGTYTIMSQIAADALGLPVEKVQFKLGDSVLPKAPVSGGSQTAASVGPAVHEAAKNARDKVLRLATADQRSPLSGNRLDDICSRKRPLPSRRANGERRDLRRNS
jgi:xanthine dehydrogenase YagR molybdenum-binding subunit